MGMGMVRNLVSGATLLSSTETITTDSFRIDEGGDLGIYYKANVATASYISIFQVSPDDIADNFVAPSGYPSIATIGGSAATMHNITQYNMMYGRILLRGITGNTGATSITTCYIFNREDIF